jgi:hypothetical protein
MAWPIHWPGVFGLPNLNMGNGSTGELLTGGLVQVGRYPPLRLRLRTGRATAGRG